MILLIYGSGGVGKEALWIAKAINKEERKWDSIAFIDDVESAKEKYGCCIYKFEEISEKFRSTDIEVCIGVGDQVLRKKLWEKCESVGYSFTSLIHPSAMLRDRVKIGKGVIVKDCVSISCDAELQDNVCIQNFSLIGHDVKVGKHTCIASGVMLAGHSSVGESVFIGTHAAVREKTSIGNNSIVAMGAMVMKDVPENVVVMGNPARIVQHYDGNSIF